MDKPENGTWHLIIGDRVFELIGYTSQVMAGEFAIIAESIPNETSKINMCEVKADGSLGKDCFIFHKIQTDDCDSCGAKGYQICAMDCPNREKTNE